MAGLPAQAINLAGGLHAAPLQVTIAAERKSAQETQSTLMVTQLAGHIRHAWQVARDARAVTIDKRLLQNIRARRGEYDPDRLAAIKAMGGSDIYAMLTSVKCRAAGSWVRDVVAAQGEARPWDIKPTQLPEMPPAIHDQIVEAALKPIMAAEQMGIPMEDIQIQQLLQALKDAAENELREQATKMASRMADKMEEQLQLGGFNHAIDEFIDDMMTFPCGIIKGPIVRKKNTLTWQPGPGGTFTPQIAEALTMEWERTSPFNMYPSPAATTINNGELIEKHSLSRQELTELIDVDGYDSASIRLVLDEYATKGLVEWWANTISQANAEGKSTMAVANNSDGTIDALQYWGSVPGKKLIEWGMSSKDIPDPTKEYHIEAWLVGAYVIKAVLNYDPLHRKPYYKASYEDVPGNWWGNGVADLVRDSQVVVNAASRAIVNNMGMSSGPQVAIDIDRLPAGEPITTLTPWKIWQLRGDPTGSGGSGGGPPIHFFQPESYVTELLSVLEKFTALADEYSGIPRYMTGDAGGAGRTASGLSMLVNNAGKSIKQVISNVDMNVMEPLLERLYMYNMMYSDDPDLKGDVNIIARGATALMAKEAAQVRRNEFLAATMNPVDMQIVGLKGRAAILRETVKTLDMDPDEIIPPPEILAAQQLLMPPGGMPGSPPAPGAGAGPPQQALPPPAPPPAGSPAAAPVINKQALSNGAPITDNFAPISKPG